MGLDQWAYTTAKQDLPAVDFKQPEDSVQIHYWRKHPNLHGWMGDLYCSKGGTNVEFNCAPVQLDLVDLALLEAESPQRQTAAHR